MSTTYTSSNSIHNYGAQKLFFSTCNSNKLDTETKDLTNGEEDVMVLEPKHKRRSVAESPKRTLSYRTHPLNHAGRLNDEIISLSQMF